MDSIDTLFRIQVQENISKVLPRLAALNKEIAKLPKGNIKIGVTGTSAAVMTSKAEAARKLSTEITKLKATGNIALNIRGNATTAMGKMAAQSKALKVELGSLGGVISRTFSRFSFLATAIIAGYVHEALTTAVHDAAALEGQLRGLEVGFAKTGISGRKFFNTLRQANQEIANMRFTAEATGKALGKMMVGGLNIDQTRLERMKMMAVGAGVMFGESPSKMMEDMSTAWLRFSWRMADNLGLIVRPIDQYKKKAEELGKAVSDLTAEEKSEAFGKGMLENAGADLLVLAASIDSPIKKLENAKERLDSFRLAMGGVMLESVMPMADALTGLGDAQLESIARWTLLTVKVTAAMVAFQGLQTVVNSMRARFGASGLTGAGFDEMFLIGARGRTMQTMRGTWGRTGYASMGEMRQYQGLQAAQAQGKQFRGAMMGTAGFVALTAAVVGVVAAFDNYNERMAKLSSLNADVLAQQIQMEQHFASLGIQMTRGITPESEVAQIIGTTDLGDTKAQAKMQEMVKSMVAYRDGLQETVDSLDLTGEKAEEIQDIINDLTGGIGEFVDELDNMGGEFGKNFEGMSEAAMKGGDQAVKAFQAVQSAMIEQQAALLQGETNWDKFLNFLRIGVMGIADLVAQTFMTIGNVIWTAVSGAAAAVAETIHMAAAGIQKFLNQIIQAYNQVAGFLNQIPGMNLPTGKAISVVSEGFGDWGGAVWDFMGGDKALENLGAFAQQGPLGNGKWGGFGLLDKDRATYMSKRQDIIDQYGTNLRGGGDRVPVGFEVPGAEGAGKKGGGGKGKAQKTREDLYNEALEKLQLELDDLDTRLELLGQFNEEDAARLKARRDQALLDFMIESETQDWGDLLSQNTDLMGEINESYDRYKNQISKMEEEMQKALDKANDTFQQMEIENQLRKDLGLEVDETKTHQQALNEYLDLAAQYGEDFANEYAGVADAAAGLKEALEEQAAMIRQRQLDYDLQQIDYEAGLAMAREGDPNRKQGIGINALLDSIDRYIQESNFLEPGTEAASEMATKLQNMHIELEEMTRQLIFDGKMTSEGKQQAEEILAQYEQYIRSTLGQLDAQAYASPLDMSAANLNQSAVNLDGSAVNLNSAAAALGAVASSIASAIANAANAAYAAGQNVTGGGEDAAGGGTNYASGGGGSGNWYCDEDG